MKHTITTIFVVPTLGISREGLDTNGFINAYIKDLGRDEQYENAVYLLFKPKNNEKFKDFLDFEMDRKGSLLDDYDIGEGYVVLVYGLSTRYAHDFELIRKGQYSKTSEEFQGLFPKKKRIYVNGKPKDEMSLQYRVFTKDKSLIDYWEDKIGTRFKENMEVWEGYDEENEIMDLEKLKELV